MPSRPQQEQGHALADAVVVVPLAGLQPTLDVDQLALREMQTAG
jgi:hypothetical protein